MNESNNDDLQTLFTQLRKEERSLAPAFRLPTETPSASAPGLNLRWLMPLAATCLAVITVLFLLPQQKSKPSLAALPALLAHDAAAVPLLASLPAPEQSLSDIISESTTDFLLPPYLRLRIL
jgi:hypothetical protein